MLYYSELMNSTIPIIHCHAKKVMYARQHKPAPALKRLALGTGQEAGLNYAFGDGASGPPLAA